MVIQEEERKYEKNMQQECKTQPPIVAGSHLKTRGFCFN